LCLHTCIHYLLPIYPPTPFPATSPLPLVPPLPPTPGKTCSALLFSDFVEENT
jgi:hypothetical protein